MSELRTTISTIWNRIQRNLFPGLKEDLGAMTVKHQELINIFETVRIEDLLEEPTTPQVGRPPSDRSAMARAFLAKAQLNLPTTEALIERLHSDRTLRCLCGWETRRQVPSSSTFSRIFQEFSAQHLPERAHRLLIDTFLSSTIIGTIARDSMEIVGNEKPEPKPTPTTAAQKPPTPASTAASQPEPKAQAALLFPSSSAASPPKPADQETTSPPGSGNSSQVAASQTSSSTPAAPPPKSVDHETTSPSLAANTPAAPVPRKRGRPRKGEEVVQPLTRIDRQLTMTYQEMCDELPKSSDVGCKINSKGHMSHWIGYKYHIDTAICGIPVNAILTSASTHDSQVAIPLMTKTSQELTYLYDTMDSAYDCEQIKKKSEELGHVAIIDKNTRRNVEEKKELLLEKRRQQMLGIKDYRDEIYNDRTVAERTNSRLRGEFGADNVKVRGHHKVLCHLMFGLLALSVDQILRFLS